MSKNVSGNTQLRGRVAIHAAAWLSVSRFVSQLSQLAMFFYAMRVLLPEDFGLYAVVSSFGILATIIGEGGWSQYLMKTQNLRDDFDHLATIGLLSGVFASLSGMTASLLLWKYWDLPEAAGLLALFSCWTLLSVASSVFEGYFVATGKFKRQAWIRISGEIAGFLVTIFGLAQGYGSPALVHGRIASQLAILLLSLQTSRRFPRAAFDFEKSLVLLHFAKHIVASRVVVFIGSYSGTLIVGNSLGLVEAGYYRAAERLVSAISECLGEPTKALAWRYFGLARENQDLGMEIAVKQASAKLLTVLLLVGAPSFLGLGLVAPSAVEVLLGHAWLPAAPIVTILCVRHFVLLPGYVTEPLLTVTGHVGKRLNLTLLSVGALLFAALASAPYGVTAMTVSQCGVAGFVITLSIRAQKKYAHVDWAAVGRNFATFGFVPALALTIVVAMVPVLAGRLLPIHMLALQVGAGALTFSAVSAVLFRLARSSPSKL